ncbi:MAG: phosphate ABC transporter permease PstA [Chloroflexota bacterium]
MSPRTADRVATTVLWIIATLVVGIVLWFLGVILRSGLPILSWHFITGVPSEINAGGGVGPELFNSLYIVALTLLFLVPISLSAAIYLAEYAGRGWITEAIRFSAEALGTLPTIVFGLFGFLIFVVGLHWRLSLMGGALTLVLLNLPLAVRVSEDAIRAVPGSLREGALAVGATRWQAIYTVVLPSALPAIITGIVLACGRIFGETAALVFTAGQNSDLRHPFDLNPFRQGDTLSVHLWYSNAVSQAPDARSIANGTAAVLVLVLLIFNMLALTLGRVAHRRLTAGE